MTQLTPIHVACLNGHISVVKTIVKVSGIGISVMDKRTNNGDGINDEPQIRELDFDEIEPFCMNVYNKNKKQQTNKTNKNKKSNKHDEL